MLIQNNKVHSQSFSLNKLSLTIWQLSCENFICSASSKSIIKMPYFCFCCIVINFSWHQKAFLGVLLSTRRFCIKFRKNQFLDICWSLKIHECLKHEFLKKRLMLNFVFWIVSKFSKLSKFFSKIRFSHPSLLPNETSTSNLDQERMKQKSLQPFFGQTWDSEQTYLLICSLNLWQKYREYIQHSHIKNRSK